MERKTIGCIDTGTRPATTLEHHGGEEFTERSPIFNCPSRFPRGRNFLGDFPLLVTGLTGTEAVDTCF